MSLGQRALAILVLWFATHATAQVSTDYRRALLAMHKGRPLALDNHNQLSASFTALARDLAGVETKKSDRPASSFIGLLSGRRPVTT